MTDNIFNKNDYKILEGLIERKCTAPASSLTIRQLINITEMSLSKVRSVIGKFLLVGFIFEGSKDGNNKTYYISDDGLKHFKTVFGFEDKDIQEMMTSFDNIYNENEGD